MSKTWLLDSGAFSAWNSGATIDVRDYRDFLREHGSRFSGAFNLDVIPTERSEVMSAAMAGLDNWLYLKEECPGVTVIPVFHFGEDWKLLDRYVEEGDGRVGIGFSWLRGGRKGTREFARQVFDRVSNRDGQPVVKVHGLGIHEPAFIRQFPWDSVDSSAWSLRSNQGIVPVIRGKKHELLPIGVRTSKWRPTVQERRWLNVYFRRFGFTLEEMRTDWKPRSQYGGALYASYEVGEWSPHVRDSFFSRGVFLDRPGIRNEGTSTYLALPNTGPSGLFTIDLHDKWLVSYVILEKAKDPAAIMDRYMPRPAKKWGKPR